MMVIERKIYQKPQCNIVCTETEALLVHASGNAGTIQPGTTVGDAKRNFLTMKKKTKKRLLGIVQKTIKNYQNGKENK